MHILFLTWKDIRHPHAGGAERVMYEYARGLVGRGHEVVWFASSFDGAPSEEVIDGIRIIRRYTNHTIWMGAHAWYRSYKQDHQIDVILDEAGGWPLLAPLYEKQIPILFFAHHIGDREFDRNTDFGFLGYIIRPLAKFVYLHIFRLYRDVPTIAVSRSTRNELVDRLGFHPDRVSVIENTTELHPIDHIDDTIPKVDIIFVGRLTAIKRPDHAIRVFARAIPDLPQETRLHIVGNAQEQAYVASLHTLVSELGIPERIVFHGFLSDRDKTQLFSRVRGLLVTSEKEGYGLVVLEANAHAIPALGYDVAGLRDSIHPGINGVIVGEGDIQKMSQEIVKLFANDEYYHTLSASSLEHARTIPAWGTQVEKLEKTITPK